MKRTMETIINPSRESAPEVRWWLAEGYHTDESLEEAVQEQYDLGMAGCEVLTLTEETIDRQLYGWGSEEFAHDMMVIAQKATSLGMALSFTGGPNYMPAVPDIDINDEACGKELNFTNVNLKGGEHFSGELQSYSHLVLNEEIFAVGPDTGEGGTNTSELPTADQVKQVLVKTVAVKLLNPDDIDKVDLNSKRPATPQVMQGELPEEFETIQFVEDSFVDISEQVRLEGDKYYLDWTAPSDGNYVVFSFWRHSTTQFADSSIDISYIVNHLDIRGMQAMQKYWDKYFFTPQMQKVIRENGNVNFFMDSLEIRTMMSSGLFWTENFLEEFEKRRGYSLVPYLPIIINYNNHYIGAPHQDTPFGADLQPRFMYDNQVDTSVRIMNDLHLTQTDLYREEFLQPMRKWLNGYGVKLRAQASYGSMQVAFDMSLQEDSLDIQETESLEMNSMIDYYRTFSGGSHMYQMPVYSAETGALFFRGYSVSLKEYQWIINRLFAGGVNRVILHGFASKYGPDNNTEWPGYDGGLGLGFPERFDTRQPFGSMLVPFTQYISRMQCALRSGTAKMDVGILNQMYHSPYMDVSDEQEDLENSAFFWKDRNLAAAGYTYEFFAPQYLERGFACEGGRFDAGNTDYRALVVYQECMPEASARELLKMAKKGMPIVLVENAGSKPSGMQDHADGLKKILDELRQLPGVSCCERVTQVAETLKKMGIMPRTEFMTKTRFYSVLRECSDGRILYLMNAGEQEDATILSLDGAYRVTEINCWTGEATQIDVSIKQGKTQFYKSLRKGDATLYFLEDTAENNVKAADPNQSMEMIPMSKPWKITVEDWSKGNKLSRTETRMGHTTTEYTYETNIRKINLELEQLKSWDQMEEVGQEVSGIGYYSNVFELPENLAADAKVVVDFKVLENMAEVEVNGVTFTGVNMLDARVDISKAVKSGQNEIKIKTCTTLFNRLLAMDRLPLIKAPLPFQPTEPASYGLTACEIYVCSEK